MPIKGKGATILYHMKSLGVPMLHSNVGLLGLEPDMRLLVWTSQWRDVHFASGPIGSPRIQGRHIVKVNWHTTNPRLE